MVCFVYLSGIASFSSTNMALIFNTKNFVLILAVNTILS